VWIGHQVVVVNSCLIGAQPDAAVACQIIGTPGDERDAPVTVLNEVPLKYKGFDIPDRHVVGYGLDYREQYRNLPFLALLDPTVFLGNDRNGK
jgi:hypoxanthine-guanine phosphoribosyltransferase